MKEKEKLFLKWFVGVTILGVCLFLTEKSRAESTGEHFPVRNNRPLNADKNGETPRGPKGERGIGMMISEEAKEACAEKEEEGSCSFTPNNSDDEIIGVCRKNKSNIKSDSEEKLVCVPNKKEISDSDLSIEDRIKKAQEMKEEREIKIENIKQRVEKIIKFLTGSDVNTDVIEENLGVLDGKGESLLGKFETYIEALKNAENFSDNSVTEARGNLKRASDDFAYYYRETLKRNISEAISRIN